MGGKLGRIGESYDCSRSGCGRLTVPSGPKQTRTRFCDGNDHLWVKLRYIGVHDQPCTRPLHCTTYSWRNRAMFTHPLAGKVMRLVVSVRLSSVSTIAFEATGLSPWYFACVWNGSWVMTMACRKSKVEVKVEGRYRNVCKTCVLHECLLRHPLRIECWP